jgi:excisionase family DNA binding protein
MTRLNNRKKRRRKGRRSGAHHRRAFSIGEFCSNYGLGRTKTYDEIRKGRLRGRKIGKRTLIARDDAESWLRRLPLVVR